MARPCSLRLFHVLACFLGWAAAAHAGTIVYVDADATGANTGRSWADAFIELQDALASVPADGSAEIWVAEGTYRAELWNPRPQSTFRLRNNVALYGGFAGHETAREERDPRLHTCVLSGEVILEGHEGIYGDNVNTVVTAENTDASAILDGFTLSANGEYNMTTDAVPGRGLRFINSDATVRNCVLQELRGRGPALHAKGGRPSIVGCVFGKTEGLAVELDGADAKLSGCSARGGLTILNASPTVVSSRFYSGGITLTGTGRPLFANCLMTGSNQGFDGAASTEPATFINCTVAGNKTGGIVCRYTGEPSRVVNSILWGNQGTRQHMYQNQIAGAATVDYSAVEGWPASAGGVGNISTDPGFVDLDGADNTVGTEDDNALLQPHSPCFDAGSNAALPPDTIDLDGDGDTVEPLPLDLAGLPRRADDPARPDTGEGTAPIVDLGCYEGVQQYLIVSTPDGRVPEGGAATFTVALSLPPAGPVRVSVELLNPDPDLSLTSTAQLEFDASSYNVPQSITLRAGEDVDFTEGGGLVWLSAPGMPPASIALRESDSEPVPPAVFVNAAAQGKNLGTSWSDAFVDLHDALAAARNRSEVKEIWVAKGTYYPAKPGGSADASFVLVSNVGVYGGFAGDETSRDQRDPARHVTTLHGDFNRNDDQPGKTADNSHRIVLAEGLKNCVLDGLTIRGGFGDSGAGVCAYDTALTLSGCRLVSNQATLRGSALYVLAGQSIIDRCWFEGNSVTGSGYYSADRYGGAAYILATRATVRDTTFVGNRVELREPISVGVWGGALYVAGLTTIDRCSFINNAASHPGMNGGASGGAIFADGPSLWLYNCVFTRNRAQSLDSPANSSGGHCAANTGRWLRPTAFSQATRPAAAAVRSTPSGEAPLPSSTAPWSATPPARSVERTWSTRP